MIGIESNLYTIVPITKIINYLPIISPLKLPSYFLFKNKHNYHKIFNH